MRVSGWIAAACCAVSLLGSCARQAAVDSRGTSGQPSAAPGIPAVAEPYAAPAKPPQDDVPLVIAPSADAAGRLGAVARGALVDSGGYHGYGLSPDGSGGSEEALAISFSSPDGNFSCSGEIRGVTCSFEEASIPRPPRPANAPRETGWHPEIELTPAALSYGTSHGDVAVFPDSKALPIGSTIRFGEIECLSERDGPTCVSYRGGFGFHLGRDALVPLKAATALAADSRAEPRTSGGKYCGALVTERAIEQAAERSWPTTGELGRWRVDIPNSYTCADVQAVMARRDQYAGQKLWSVGVLLFDKGSFAGPATERPYDNLYAQADPDDPSIVQLSFALKQGGTGHARAQCQNGKAVLLDPVPDGAQQAP